MCSRKAALLALAFAVQPLVGCATIFNDDTTKVSIRTEPTGIQVSTSNDGKSVNCVSDCVLDLKNDEDHVLRFEDPEIFTTERNISSSITGWFYVNLLIGLPGVILMGVDWLTGNMHSLSHDEIFVEFIDDTEDDNMNDEEDDEDLDREEEDADEEESLTEDPSPNLKTLLAPVPAVDSSLTGIAALPNTTAIDREQIERAVPASRIAEAIRNYYGDLSENQRQRIRDRLYRILKNQTTPDLDQAIAIETHDRLR